MELPLSYVLGGEEIAKADRPNWRLFRVPHTPSATPQADMIAEDPDTKMPAKWLVSNETNAAKFSAVCYLTAKHISEMLWGDAPFGLIWASWGGTRGEHRVPLFSDGLGYWSETHGAAVEAWAPPETKKTCPSAAAMPPEGGPQEYSHLYNGMIHPLTRYSIRGAFWFQGEHNIVTGSSRQEYACTFGAMINAWRDAWTGIGGGQPRSSHGVGTLSPDADRCCWQTSPSCGRSWPRTQGMLPSLGTATSRQYGSLRRTTCHTLAWTRRGWR